MDASKMVAALFVGLAALEGTARAGGPNARDIVAKSVEASRLEHVVLGSTLTIGETGGAARSKSFTLERKLAGDGVHYRTRTRFSAPAEIRGEAVLFDERPGGRNDVLLYLPRYKKTRRVEPQAQRSSFMGSSFSYADMTTHGVDDYRHELVRSEPCPGDARATCQVVRSTPANDEVRASHGYAHKTTWIRTRDFQTVQLEVFDEHDALWKRIVFSDIREVDAARHKAIPFTIRVDDVKARRFSVIAVHEADAQAPLSDAIFSAESLSREP